jgi:hypothetical protein
LRAVVESLLAAHADVDGLSESFWVAVQDKRTQALFLIQDAFHRKCQTKHMVDRLNPQPA